MKTFLDQDINVPVTSPTIYLTPGRWQFRLWLTSTDTVASIAIDQSMKDDVDWSVVGKGVPGSPVALIQDNPSQSIQSVGGNYRVKRTGGAAGATVTATKEPRPVDV